MAKSATTTSVCLLKFATTICVFGTLPLLIPAYSNDDFHGICSPDNDSNNNLLTSSINLMKNLVVETPRLPNKYFCSDLAVNGFTQYGEASCTSDASFEDCDECLSAAKQYLMSDCGYHIGGQTSENGGRCKMRYENYNGWCIPTPTD